MHQSISINTLCFAPAGFDIIIDAVAHLDARAVSPDLELVTSLGVAKAARHVRDAGLQVATLTHRAFAFANSSEALTARDRLRRTIDVAAGIGAQSIIMTTGGRGSLSWADAAVRFAEAVAPCADLARQAGIPLGVEPTSHLYSDVSIAHKLSDTVVLARQASLSVMIDFFACWFDPDIEAAITEAGPLTSLVQVSDYVYGDRGLPCRAVPGDGVIPLAALIPMIVQAGFRGLFDLEIIGPRLLSEGEHAGLTRAGEYIGALLARSGLPAE